MLPGHVIEEHIMFMAPFPLLAAFAMVWGLASQSVHASDDLQTSIRAKLAKEKTKTARDDRMRERDEALAASGAGGVNDCGRVDIGNFYAGAKPDKSVREINVIITGDVINANNHCK